jgi:hypothetical protein
MIIISHRALLDGPDLDRENSPWAIDDVIRKGFDVEIDVQVKDGIPYLGHDGPVYPISWSFLSDIEDQAWIHCKTIDALDLVIENIGCSRVFFHDKDDCVVVNDRIWTYPRPLPLTENSICVLPEVVFGVDDMVEKVYNSRCAGVCTDYPLKFKLT